MNHMINHSMADFKDNSFENIEDAINEASNNNENNNNSDITAPMIAATASNFLIHSRDILQDVTDKYLLTLHIKQK